MYTYNPRRVTYLRDPASFEKAPEVESRYPSFGTLEYPASPYFKDPEFEYFGYPPSDLQYEEPYAPAVWHRTFNHIDYASYKAACEAQRIAKPENNPDVLPLVSPAPHRRRGGLSRIGAMLTIYPYRDMGWLVTMVFIAGSIALTIHGAFSLLPLLSPKLDFSGRNTGVQLTLILGGAFFTLSGLMGIVAAFNVDRGSLDPKKDAPDAYKPALLQSQEWVWYPDWNQLCSVYLPNLAFRPSILQFVGGIAFTFSAVADVPGVFDFDHPNKRLFFVSAPQLFGDSFFLFAAILTIYLSQDRWYKPKPLDASWQSGFWSSIGAGALLAAGILSLLAKDRAFVIAGLFLGAGQGFLTAALTQWYIIMEFYPVNPYTRRRPEETRVPGQLAN